MELRMYCITSKKIMHKKYVIMCWRVRKRRNSTGSECSVRFPSGKHTMTSMCLVLVILTYYSAFYLLPKDLFETKLKKCAYFRLISRHFFASNKIIFHKTEVQKIILRCLTGLNSDMFNSYDTKCNYFHFCFFAILYKKHTFAFFVFLRFMS